MGDGGLRSLAIGIEQTGLAHAFALVINDDAVGGLGALEADLDGAVRQVARGFEAERFEGEGVVGADMALFLDEEQFVVGLIGRQETHPTCGPGRSGPAGSCPGRNEPGRCIVPRPIA